jgi:hypothetical protein
LTRVNSRVPVDAGASLRVCRVAARVPRRGMFGLKRVLRVCGVAPMTFGTDSAVVQMEEATRQNAAVVEDAPAAAQAMQRRVPQDRHLERMAVPIDGVALKPAAQRPIQLGQPDLRPARKEP